MVSDYVAGSTGLLRAPFLDFIDEPFRIGMTDLRTGESRRGQPLVGEYEDFASADDWFPYIDSPIKKPNVGRVLYVVVPPPAVDERYPNSFSANFEWTIPNQTYNAWAGSPQLLWVHSVEVTRGDVPTVGNVHRLADWSAGTEVPLDAEGVMTRRHPGFFDPHDRDLWDPCRYLTDSFGLDGTISASPLHTIESPQGNPVEVWDLFRARIHYAYLGVDDADPGGPDPCPTSGNLCATGQLDSRCVVQQPQEPDRHIDIDDALIDDEGNYSYTGSWYNNKDNSAYTVTLDYRYCVSTDSDPDCADAANWSESILESVRLRFDKRCDCDHDSHDYQREEDQCCNGGCCGD